MGYEKEGHEQGRELFQLMLLVQHMINRSCGFREKAGGQRYKDILGPGKQ